MALEKIRLGTNEDGSPHYLYRATDPDEVLLLTGPITGTVDVDGKSVDVTDTFIAVKKDEALAISDAIGERYVDEGHPAHDSDVPFVHVPSTDTEA